jgi:hypothetical protein
LGETADSLANIKIDYEEMVEKLFIIDKEAAPITIKTMEQKRSDLLKLLQAPDIQKFENTGWGFINAVSDMTTHATPTRKKSPEWKANRMSKVLDGYDLLNQAYELVKRVA